MKKCLLFAGIIITLFSPKLLAYNQISDFPSVKAAQKNYDLAMEALNQASKNLGDAQSNVTTIEKLYSEKNLKIQKLEQKRAEIELFLNIADGIGAKEFEYFEAQGDLAQIIKYQPVQKAEISKIESNLKAARELSKSREDNFAQSKVVIENTRQNLAFEIKNAQAELDSKKDENICNDCLPKAIGDIVHRASGITTAYVGHAGIFMGDMKIAHVTGDSGRGTALDLGNFQGGEKSFMENHPMSEFWGAKRYAGVQPLTESQQMELAKVVYEYKEVGVEYDYFHGNQKGNKLQNGRFQFDCVGFTEHLWEKITNLQRDPTPAEKERPVLTVWAQRDSVFAEDVH